MALRLRDRYSTRANEATIDYPTGSFKAKSTPTATDGTPLQPDWANDILGARDALLKRAGIIASGAIETADVSDVLDAIEFIVNDLSPGAASETVQGVIELATNAEALALVDMLRAVTPARLGSVLNANVIGMTQTWQDVIGSRSTGVLYTNSTGRSIQLGIATRSSTSANTVTLEIDGVQVYNHTFDPTATAVSINHIVPNGATYRLLFTGGSILQRWTELR